MNDMSVEYVWREFVNPNYCTYDQVVQTLQSYFPNNCPQ